jgi:NAD(P)-dependent dehydrogenase (short-subunit alcohol dehydrogenase family)
MTKPVCLILGAGAGIGGHVAKRFAREGYHACLVRRADNAGACSIYQRSLEVRTSTSNDHAPGGCRWR